MDTKAIAKSTVAALERGQYPAADGRAIDLSTLLASCLRDTRSYEPEALADLREQVLAQPGSQPQQPRLQSSTKPHFRAALD